MGYGWKSGSTGLVKVKYKDQGDQQLSSLPDNHGIRARRATGKPLCKWQQGEGRNFSASNVSSRPGGTESELQTMKALQHAHKTAGTKGEKAEKASGHVLVFTI